VWQWLEEHGADLAESTVRPHVARLKVEVGLSLKEVMVSQAHPETAEAEVDFPWTGPSRRFSPSVGSGLQ
jgi:hypothetical protein